MKQKTGRKLFSFLLSLALVLGLLPGMSLTAYAAETTVTWDINTLKSMGTHGSLRDGQSFTKDGITLTVLSGNINYMHYDDLGDAGWSGYSDNASFKFSTTAGNFKKIEITGTSWILNGTGWASTSPGSVWTGDASETTFGQWVDCTNIVFTIEPASVDVTGVTLNKTTATLTVGGTETLTATVSPEDATDKSVTWASDNTAVATVADGVVTAVAPGTANITVTTTDGSFTATCTVTVNKADPTAPTGLTATYGQTLADVTLPTGWTWADSTQSVGNVGSNTFKANFSGDDNYNAASNVDVTVTVNKAANPATVTNTASVTKGGNTVDLAGNVTLNGATGAVSYEISGEANGCSLNGSVLTAGDTAGSVTVNVTVAEDDNYNALAATPITVTINDKLAQTITASDVTATYGDTGKSVSGTTSGDGAISYSVKSGDAVTVDGTTGALTINKVGTATVIVTAAETSTYAQATKEVTVTINKANAVAAKVTANNRTYDGTDKPLVNVDDSTLVGGEMWYALGTDETTAPADDLYTTSIPTATAAGT